MGSMSFVKEVKKYAKKNDKKLSVYMHHTSLNSGQNIDGSGIEYNLKLMLGIDYDQNKFKKQSALEFDPNSSENTFFDEMVFFNNDLQTPMMQNMFTACIHYYQSFTVNNYSNGQWNGSFDWYTSSGAGCDLTHATDKKKLDYSEMLYNKRLGKIHDSTLIDPAIKIMDYKAQIDFHYLLVHVKGNEIVDVIPKFIPKEDVRLKKPLLNVKA
jgi:hypothetical protein